MWRGKGTPSSAQLAVRLIDTLPKPLTQAFRVVILEGFFKTAKHRFGFHRFGQQTLLGVYRWLIVYLISFVLTHWVYLSTGSSQLPDWGASAALALNSLFSEVVVCLLLIDVERTRVLLQSIGLDLQLVEVKT